MNYDLPKLNWAPMSAIIILVFLVLFFSGLPNMDNVLIKGGFGIFVLTVLYGWLQEENTKEEFRKLLLLEIFRNIKFINENIQITLDYRGKGKTPRGFCYLDDITFKSILNSGRINIFEPRVFNNLSNAYNSINSINKKMDFYFGERIDFLMLDEIIFESLKRAKWSFKITLNLLGENELYEKARMQGIKRTLSEEHILEGDIVL